MFSNCITSSGGFRAYKSPYGELYSHFTGILTSAGWTSCQHSSIKRTFPVSIQRLNTDISYYLLCQAPLFFHSRHWKNFCISSGERRTFQFHSSASRKSRILRCLIPSRLISSSSIVTTYFGKLSRTPANAPNSRWMVSSEASR